MATAFAIESDPLGSKSFPFHRATLAKSLHSCSAGGCSAPALAGPLRATLALKVYREQIVLTD
jgi:hypothetical protein